MSRDRSRAYFSDLRRIDLARFNKAWRSTASDLTITWGDGFQAFLRKRGDDLYFDFGGVTRKLTLAWQPRHFGGAQCLIRCQCWRPVRVVYFVGSAVCCRTCIRGAIYRTQGLSAEDRAYERFVKLRARIRRGTEDHGPQYF